jgi:hypothetical protein
MRRSLPVFAATALLSSWIPAAMAADPPAAPITSKMGDVTDELNRKQTGKPVQTEQKAIVDDLDKLIASLEKKRANCRGGLKNARPNNGMDDSRIGRGPGGMGDLVNTNDSVKDWAKLSARERDRILQSMSEGFPPEYRLVLERYYRRLAEEKSAPSSGDQSKPKAEEPKTEKP